MKTADIDRPGPSKHMTYVGNTRCTVNTILVGVTVSFLFLTLTIIGTILFRSQTYVPMTVGSDAAYES